VVPAIATIAIVTLVVGATLATVWAQDPSPSSSASATSEPGTHEPDPQACIDYWAHAAMEGSTRPYGDESIDAATRMEELETCVTGTELAEDLRVVVWEDPVNGLVCVRARQSGEVSGAACTLTSAEYPMVTGVGTVPSEPILMLVVDPNHRLGGVGFQRDGEQLEQREVEAHQPNSGPGLVLAAEVDQWPDTVRVVDGESNELLVIDARDLVDTSEELPEEAPAELDAPSS
jgi:hypothetical protein